MEFLLKYSPLSWTTLDISGIGLNKDHPGLWYCIAIYLTAAVAMGILIMTFGRKKEEQTQEETTKECPYCKSEISIDATRCPHCTSKLEGYDGQD